MRQVGAGILTLLFLGTPASAQLLGRQYTNPTAPSRVMLDRLNLKMAWRAYVPVEGRRDGIFSVQITDRQILAQTISGVIVALDPDTGAAEWRTRPGPPYRVTHPLGYNKKYVFALRGDHLHALERSTGRTLWTYILPDGPTTAPLADDAGIYVCLGTGRVYAFALPDLEEWKRYKEQKEKAARAERERKEKEGDNGSKGGPSLDLYSGSSGIAIENLAALLKEEMPEPLVAWDYLFESGRLLLTPLQTSEALVLAATDGSIFSTSKFERHERFRIKAQAPVAAPLGQHGNMAYIASEDFNLYALNISGGRIVWRFTAGAPILQKPEVTDTDVYVAPQGRGLYRVNRRTGKAVWHNRDAQRFLAVNRKFVYAFDRSGRLLVLDLARGIKLGMLDSRDFVVPISNELTDRAFLASHNGLLVCVHDYDQKTPLINKKVQEQEVKGFKPKEEQPKKKDEKGNKDKEDKGNKNKE
jgi:outer membrane protein assembly factor BamB